MQIKTKHLLNYLDPKQNKKESKQCQWQSNIEAQQQNKTNDAKLQAQSRKNLLKKQNIATQNNLKPWAICKSKR